MSTPEVARTLRALAEKHAGVNTVLWVDEDQGGREVRVSDLLRDEARLIGDAHAVAETALRSQLADRLREEFERLNASTKPNIYMTDTWLFAADVALSVMRVPREIPDVEHLRDYLHALNDDGIDCRAVGIDARGEPFLVTLSGPYADTEVVLYGNPWDNEFDWGTGPCCVECMAQHPHGIDSLRFPVLVLERKAPAAWQAIA